ncbi:hypothetical protein J2Z21_008731 [Streptomyces griseochromogenes]|uniref:RNA polymerase subunit sigma-70 n=1 Tax=Streptomyces griseochromogenes TaxID=68214 RepID=A0A1B1B0J1_9ACTN|nr:hypothetical protein AVL59_24650 [Streptomyces griseochromogenes]MBP2055715.1 hypothetical protein [Streptomyces griseochromogenes]
MDPACARRIVEEFLAAATSGRTERLVALLTDDATAVSDGYGPARRLLLYKTRERVVGAVAFEVSDGKVASLHGIAAADRLARLNVAWRQHEPDAPVISAW